MSDRPSSSEKLASTPFNKKLSLFHETRGRQLRINRKSQNTLAVIEKTTTRRVGMVRYFSSSIRGCIRLRSSDSWLGSPGLHQSDSNPHRFRIPAAACRMVGNQHGQAGFIKGDQPVSLGFVCLDPR